MENRITSHRPIAVGETLRSRSHEPAPGRAHPKGTAVDFLDRPRTVDGETVWESASTYLRRGRDGDVVSASSTDASTDPAPSRVVPGRMTWWLAGDLGRRYAAVSGDHNPIHLYPLTAKALGFPRQIAHGMWSLARCVAALENRLPDAVTVEARSRSRSCCPAPSRSAQDAVPDGITFALTRPESGAPHLVGRTHPA